MNTSEVKERISKMTPEERDDIRLYMDSLDDGFELSDELRAELERRRNLFDSGQMSARPAKEVLNEWKDKIKAMRS